ncbi:MAG TPA: OmpA family protein [Bacillota bacterium]|nr:OmpA family protein [Bacillota bacterium]
MKLSKFTNLLVLGLVLTMAASGCRKKPGFVTPLPAGMTKAPTTPGPGEAITPGPAVPETATSGPSATDIEKQGGIPFGDQRGHPGWVQNRDQFKSDTVHFAFDSSVVQASDKPHVAAVADYLKANPAQAVLVEGHCDERGTEEYNRALGERRALAIRESLVSLGIDPTRVDTVSFGEDKPAVTGQGEAVWRQNRRGEFILLTPPAAP